jgi:hypothetical protein
VRSHGRLRTLYLVLFVGGGPRDLEWFYLNFCLDIIGRLEVSRPQSVGEEDVDWMDAH